ncbi:hypothetical protein D3C73_1509020 [compost metagenome]
MGSHHRAQRHRQQDQAGIGRRSARYPLHEQRDIDRGSDKRGAVKQPGQVAAGKQTLAEHPEGNNRLLRFTFDQQECGEQHRKGREQSKYFHGVPSV